MASITMTASLLGGSAAGRKVPATTHRRGAPMVVRASREAGEIAASSNREESNNSNGRRNLMFAVMATAASAVAKAAMADEPKPGTPEAKKKYAPVCVTMPTAKICRY